MRFIKASMSIWSAPSNACSRIASGSAARSDTGGVGQCWEITSNSWEYTGDGIAMSLAAGADLIDMEMTQFHPTGMVWPTSGRGSPHGGVFLDIASRRDAEYIRRRLPSMYQQFRELADVDITSEAMEVG